MTDQNLDYVAIRRNVEKGVQRQKKLNRVIFFGVHVVFFIIAMLVMWGTASTDSQLRELLFGDGGSRAVIVILPTILWGMALFFHMAALFSESGVADKQMREKLLMREVGEEILRKGLIEEDNLEKPKRRAAALDADRVRLSDDGEFVPVDSSDGAEEAESGVSGVRGNHARRS